MTAADVKVSEDGFARCPWAGPSPDYVAYHDHEWGRPLADDHRLFEKICLEGFQAGLSWLTILRKREAFRRGFAHFDPAVVATFGSEDVDRLLADPAIVRHRGKINSAVNNAARALELMAEHGSLAAYFWGFEPPPAERPARLDWATLGSIATSPTSARLAADLKRRGWTFVGPTTVYAFMQATGLVNDHVQGCCVRQAVLAERARFGVPRRIR